MNANKPNNRRMFFRKAAGILSFSTALFIFQACYGTPQDFENDYYIEGTVKSAGSGAAIQGIKVSIDGYPQEAISDAQGKFSFYAPYMEEMFLKFEDIDSVQQGLYLNHDTVITNMYNNMKLDIALKPYTK